MVVPSPLRSTSAALLAAGALAAAFAVGPDDPVAPEPTSSAPVDAALRDAVRPSPGAPSVRTTPGDAVDAPELPRLAPRATVTGPERARGIEALAQISYPWRALDWTIEFRGPREGFMGVTFPDDRRIEIYLRAHQRADDIAVVVAHELGHAVDLAYNDEDRRARWQELRGHPPETPWFGCGACSDFSTSAGDYAEVFAWWQTQGRDYRSALGPPPDDDLLAELLPLFHP